MARVLMLFVLVATLAGCAGDPRSSKGLQWVIEQERERQELDRAGFPQYNDS